MYRDACIGVVVPAYNEEQFIGRVLETIPAYVDRMYVIDDGSTDGTWCEITRIARRQNDTRVGDESRSETRIVPIRTGVNRGVGFSIKTGYRRAVEDGIDVTAVMAGDGQMDPAYLDRLVDPIVAGEADYAKGDRLSNPGNRSGMSRWRLFGNTVLTGLTRIASGYWSLTDPQNGFTAISTDAIAAINLDRLYEDYGFCNDLLISLNAAGMRVIDVEMPAVYGDEESSIRYGTFIPKLSALLARRFVWRLSVKSRPWWRLRSTRSHEEDTDHG